MKFRSERDSLVEALATAGRAVGGRGGGAAVLSGLLLDCAGNQLTVTGTDLDLTIRVDQEVIGLDDGACVVPARLAADIVRSLEPGAVDRRGRRGQGRDLGLAVAVRAAGLPGGRVPGHLGARGGHDHPARRGLGRRPAPGGAGGLERRRPAPLDRGPADQRGRGHPAGGHRLLPPGAARPGRHRRAAGRGRHLGPGPGPGRAPTPVVGAFWGRRGRPRPRWPWPRGPTRSPSPTGRCGSAPACSTATTPTTAS